MTPFSRRRSKRAYAAAREMWARFASSFTEMRPSSVRSRSSWRSTSSSALRADDRPAMVGLPFLGPTPRPCSARRHGRTSRSNGPSACTYVPPRRELYAHGPPFGQGGRAMSVQSGTDFALPADHPGRLRCRSTGPGAAAIADGRRVATRPGGRSRVVDVHRRRARAVGHGRRASFARSTSSTRAPSTSPRPTGSRCRRPGAATRPR